MRFRSRSRTIRWAGVEVNTLSTFLYCSWSIALRSRKSFHRLSTLIFCTEYFFLMSATYGIDREKEPLVLTTCGAIRRCKPVHSTYG